MREEKIQAICKLALPDIKQKREKIIFSIMEIIIANLSNDCLKTTPGKLAEEITDEIITALEEK